MKCLRSKELVLLLLLFTFGAHAQITLPPISPWAYLVPDWAIEMEVNNQYRDVVNRLGYAKNRTAENTRIVAITQKLLQSVGVYNKEAPNWKWEIGILTGDEVNAHTFPGGAILINEGVFTYLTPTDDELAIFVGHEISHLLRRHTVSRIAADLIQKFGIERIAKAVQEQQTQALMEPLISKGFSFLNQSFNRGEEEEADLLGLELAARAGYNPGAAISLWEKINANSVKAASWLVSNPDITGRSAKIRASFPSVMPLYQNALVNVTN